VWGADAQHVFAVGEGGLILQYDGALWRVVDSPPTQDLFGVWGTGARDVYAVGGVPGNGHIMHFDGLQWSTPVFGLPRMLGSVWGAGPDVWAGGEFGALYRKQADGAWIAQPALPRNPGDTVSGDPNVGGIAGLGPSEVLAAGNLDTLFYFDGASWSPYFEPVLGRFYHAVWAGGGQFMVVGNDWGLWRFTPPATLAALTEQDGADFLNGVWGTDPNHHVLVGNSGRVVTWDGTRARSMSPLGVDLHAVWGATLDEVWLVGTHGTIVRATHLF
jgi:hypothetical protein